MNKQSAGLIAGIGLALLFFGYFAFVRSDERVTRPVGDDDALRLKQQQQYDALNEKVDRLTYLMQSVPGGTGLPRSANAVREAEQDRQRFTPQQNEAAQRQAKYDLDEQLESQPVDATWSLESTRAIERSLKADKLREIGAPPPAATAIDCRTSICRIHLAYGDSGSASDAGMLLNMAIADRMPYTQVLSQAHADGGVDYFIYATRDPLATRPR